MTWYAIRTKSQREKQAVQDIIAAGGEAFSPHEIVHRRFGSSKRRRRVEAPLMVGYCIASLPWIKSKAIIGPVMSAANPAIIDDVTAARLRLLSSCLGTSPMSLRVGSRVTAPGPWRDQETIIKEIKGHVARVELTLFGKVHSVKIALHQLDAA